MSSLVTKKTLLSLRVIPGARQESLEYLTDGSWKLKLRARAFEGKANEALCKIIACWVDLPSSQVSIRRGKNSRQKLVQVLGLEPEEVKCCLLEHAIIYT